MMQDTEKKLLIPALRTTLQEKRVQLEHVEFSIKEQSQIKDRAFEEGRRAGNVQSEKQRLADSIREEIATLERMVKEYGK